MTTSPDATNDNSAPEERVLSSQTSRYAKSLIENGEADVFDALLPIAANIIRLDGWLSPKAIWEGTDTLAYMGTLYAVTCDVGEDDENYGWISCNLRDDFEEEVLFRRDEGLEEHDDTDASECVRDDMESKMEAAILVIRGATRQKDVAVKKAAPKKK
jgi:hypothetical protein